MANTITHGSTDIVNASAKVTDAALANVYANTAGNVVANNTYNPDLSVKIWSMSSSFRFLSMAFNFIIPFISMNFNLSTSHKCIFEKYLSNLFLYSRSGEMALTL